MILGNTVRFAAYTIDRDAMPALFEALDGKRVAVVSGEKSFGAAKDRLPRLDICCHVRYGRECTMDIINAVAEACGECGARAVLGIGGGKALDVAKGAGQIVGLPVYTLPTIAATCAAVTALSVVYHDNGTIDRLMLLNEPPVQAFFDTALLAAEPARYFRAGLLDAMAKHLECTLTTRGRQINYPSRLGREISNSIFEPLLEIGLKAYRDCERGEATRALADALQSAVVSTGLTSLLVDDVFNGAVAHSVCYGLGALPGMEGRVLHGEMVAYGCLVQLMMDGQAELCARLRRYIAALGAPVTLAEMGLTFGVSALAPAIAEMLKSPDMSSLPYEVTGEMLYKAMEAVEALA